jgi:hypothetical protein
MLNILQNLGDMGISLDRKEAVALLTKLVADGLVSPRLVVVEEREPDSFQLKLKGFYEREFIKIFTEKNNFLFEEDTSGYLLIYKP